MEKKKSKIKKKKFNISGEYPKVIQAFQERTMKVIYLCDNKRGYMKEPPYAPNVSLLVVLAINVKDFQTFN